MGPGKKPGPILGHTMALAKISVENFKMIHLGGASFYDDPNFTLLLTDHYTNATSMADEVLGGLDPTKTYDTLDDDSQRRLYNDVVVAIIWLLLRRPGIGVDRMVLSNRLTPIDTEISRLSRALTVEIVGG